MRTKKILEELYNTLKDAGAKELTFSEKEETGLPYDVVVMLLDGFGTTTNTAQCEFYFLTKEELGTDMFFCRITLTEEVVPENIPGLCAEIAVLNLELPLGAVYLVIPIGLLLMAVYYTLFYVGKIKEKGDK